MKSITEPSRESCFSISQRKSREAKRHSTAYPLQKASVYKVKEEKIKLFATHSERKAQIVERLNRTIKRILLQYFTKKIKRRYIDILQDIASKYNASYHRGIKMAPKDVRKDNEIQSWVNLYEKRLSHKRRKKSRFGVGDFVRLTIEKAPFMKRYQGIWTEEVFIIDVIVYGNSPT